MYCHPDPLTDGHPSVVNDVVQAMRANKSPRGVADGIRHIRDFCEYQVRRHFVETLCPTPGGGNWAVERVHLAGGPSRISDVTDLCAALKEATASPANQFAVLEEATAVERGLLLHFRAHLFSMIGDRCLCTRCLARGDRQERLDMSTVLEITWWVATIDGLFSARALAAGSPASMPKAACTHCTAAGARHVFEAMALEREAAALWRLQLEAALVDRQNSGRHPPAKRARRA